MTETQNIQTTPEGDSYDELYSERSPEYIQITERWGRMLTPGRVIMILAAHGFAASELIEDTHDPILNGATELPDLLDAALLYAWLGY